MDNNQQPYGQQPPPPPQAPYGPQPQPPFAGGPPQNNLALASLILGIVAIVFCWAGYFAIVPLICGIVAVILGVKAQKEMPVGAPNRGMAIAGLVMGIVGAVLSLIFFACTLVAVCTVNSYVNEWNNALNDLIN